MKPLSDVRLALCAAGELFGGVERQVLDLCRYAKRRTGAFPPLAVFYEGLLCERAQAMGVRTTLIRGHNRYDPRLARRLAEWALGCGANVLHVHGYLAMIVAGLARTRLGHVRLLKTEHGLLEPSGVHPVAWGKMRTNRTLDWLATSLAADAVCYVTAELKHRYRLIHCGPSRHVIKNGIDPLDRGRFLRPADLELGPFHLGVVGRVTDVKGISTALRALARPEMPRTVRLNVIGSGPAESALRTQAAALGLGERVRFLGFRANVHDYIAHLDALLMPSLHEGLPYTLLEAMSLALPIVASRVGGLAEVLCDRETGVLVSVGDANELSKAIVELVADPTGGRSYGARAALEQRAAYTLDTMGEAYWQLYSDF